MTASQIQVILDRLNDLERNVIDKIDQRVTALEIVNAEKRGAAQARALTADQSRWLIGVVAGAIGAVGSAVIYAVIAAVPHP